MTSSEIASNIEMNLRRRSKKPENSPSSSNRKRKSDNFNNKSKNITKIASQDNVAFSTQDLSGSQTSIELNETTADGEFKNSPSAVENDSVNQASVEPVMSEEASGSQSVLSSKSLHGNLHDTDVIDSPSRRLSATGKSGALYNVRKARKETSTDNFQQIHDVAAMLAPSDSSADINDNDMSLDDDVKDENLSNRLTGIAIVPKMSQDASNMMSLENISDGTSVIQSEKISSGRGPHQAYENLNPALRRCSSSELHASGPTTDKHTARRSQSLVYHHPIELMNQRAQPPTSSINNVACEPISLTLKSRSYEFPPESDGWSSPRHNKDFSSYAHQLSFPMKFPSSSSTTSQAKTAVPQPSGTVAPMKGDLAVFPSAAMRSLMSSRSPSLQEDGQSVTTPRPVASRSNLSHAESSLSLASVASKLTEDDESDENKLLDAEFDSVPIGDMAYVASIGCAPYFEFLLRQRDEDDAIKQEIELHINETADNYDNYTPLLYAAKNRFPDVVELLCKLGANINYRGGWVSRDRFYHHTRSSCPLVMVIMY
jgi:hypothetical protein